MQYSSTYIIESQLSLSGYKKKKKNPVTQLAQISILVNLLCFELHHFRCVWLRAPLWAAAHQAPLSMGFSRREYWSGLPCPPSGDLPNSGIEPRFPSLEVNSLLSESWGQKAFCSYSQIENEKAETLASCQMLMVFPHN